MERRVNLPLVYKYLVDPTHVGGSGCLPSITAIAALAISISLPRASWDEPLLASDWILGIPTGSYDAHYKRFRNAHLSESESANRIRRADGSLILDQTLEPDVGLIVLGGAAAWRGGENKIHNYRAPSGTLYGLQAISGTAGAGLRALCDRIHRSRSGPGLATNDTALQHGREPSLEWSSLDRSAHRCFFPLRVGPHHTGREWTTSIRMAASALDAFVRNCGSTVLTSLA